MGADPGQMSDTVLFDTGTFTATLSEEVGGGTFEGEYVAVSEVKENGLEIRSLTAFPKRQPPGASSQGWLSSPITKPGPWPGSADVPRPGTPDRHGEASVRPSPGLNDGRLAVTLPPP